MIFSTMKARLLLSLTLGLALGATAARAQSINLETATIADLQAAMAKGTLNSEKLTQMYLARIAAYDQQGPNINTVIYANPKALEAARALDAERKAGKVRGPLHGIPIVLKDNYNTYDMPTTAGCQLLEGSLPPADAFVVAKLRAAGAVILAKVNLSEFAGGGSIGAGGGYARPGAAAGATPATPPPPPTLTSPRHGLNIPGAQSTMGGLTVNPHDITKSVAGSSGGTGAAIAADFAQFGLGSDTGGSIRLPCAANGIAGLKPTRGLLSRSGIVPLALSFDTGGPMARSVYDVAVALGVMTGVDPTDAATTSSAGEYQTDYTKFLKKGSLKGARIGVARDFFGQNPETDRVMEESIAKLKELGATIIDPIKLPQAMMGARSGILTLMIESEFKAQIADYLATLKPGYPRNLAELAAKAADPDSHYRTDAKRDGLKRNDEMALALDDPIYLAAKNEGLAFIRATMLGVFEQNHLDAMVYPTSPKPAGPSGVTGGGGGAGAVTPSGLANQTGFPDLIVPAGMTSDGLPVTISFFGLAYSEPKLLGYGYDFEQATHALRLPKYTPALGTDAVGN
jgi:amidase